MTSKNLIILCTMLTSYASYAQTKPFVIDGTLKGAHSGYIYLNYAEGGRSYKRDSTLVKNGAFKFTGNIPHPVSANITIDPARAMYGEGDVTEIFIEPTHMQLALTKGDFKSAKLTGSATQREYETMQAGSAAARTGVTPLNKAYDALNKQYIAAYRKKDSVAMEPLKKKLEVIKDQMEPYQEQISANNKNFITKNPQSWVSAYLLRFYLSNMKVEEGEQLYAQMPAAMQESFYGKEIRKELEGLRMGSPGSVAHVFSKQDINGEMLNLADYKGKYVLIDFWASWCGPCRKGNPHLKSLYSKYKDKGLEIIGISDDDRDLAAWKKAVDQDGIGIWKHVLRGLDMQKAMKGEDNPTDLSDNYGIHSLPTKILIDPKGVIIGRYGGGGENDEAMDKKLAEVFN